MPQRAPRTGSNRGLFLHGESANEPRRTASANRPVESALTVANSRWYVQAERWLGIMNKATIFDQTLNAMCLAGKACGPLLYDSQLGVLRYVGQQEVVAYQDDVSRSTLMSGAGNQSPAIAVGFHGNYNISIGDGKVSNPEFYVRAGNANLINNGEYFLYEPYTDFAGVQLALTQRVIESIRGKLVRTHKELASREQQEVLANDIQSNQLEGFVSSYLANEVYSLLMVQGPPGTGKTYTLGKTVERFGRARRGDIVCVAKTKRAVDEISRKLEQLGINHTNRNHQDDPDGDSVHCCTINSYLARNSPLHSRKILLIDEVSQLTLPFIFMAMKHAETIRLFGDQKQLHPIIPIVENPERINGRLADRIIPMGMVENILEDRLGRDRTTFSDPSEETMFDRDSVMGLIPKMLNHPMGKSILDLDSPTLKGITGDVAESVAASRFRLVQGYRMNSVIQMFPNTYWYDGALQAPLSEGVERVPGFEGGKSALTDALNASVVFIAYVADTYSEANTSDVEQTIVEDIFKCWEELKIDEDGCGVVVPFRAQEAKLVGSGVLANNQCATVERFQGRDLDRAIVSLVTNTHTRFLTETRVFTENKYNVAITRAKDQLIVIGSEAMFDGTILKNFDREACSHPCEHLLRQYPEKYLRAVYEHYQFYKNDSAQSSMLRYDVDAREYRIYM